MTACRIHEIDGKYSGIRCSRGAWDQDPEGLCLLHSRQPDKDKNGAFTEAVKAKLKSEDYDFRGVFFPGPFYLRELTGGLFTFAKPASFILATFQEADFSGATFQKADFSLATFHEQADFSVATFQEADFSDATFQMADFHWTTFQKADFSLATFHEQANFSGAKFHEQADFSGAKFQKADFDRTTFKEAKFSGATFQKATFPWVEFQARANFYKATFQEADFFFATFQNADFRWAIFQEADFRAAIFQEADFRSATVQDAKFTKANFQERANFSGATFQGEARFVDINHEKEAGPPSPAFSGDFRFVTLDKEASLVFQDVSLSRLLFAGTDMRAPIFRHVDWHPYHVPALDWLLCKLPSAWRRWFRGRQAVYDEILLRERLKGYGRRFRGLVLKYGWRAAHGVLATGKKEPRKVSQDEYARVEELYQGLKQNYEKVGDYKRVGDFHYGEMEMHRRASPWRWLPVYWYNLYKFLSGYGERPLWAFFILLGFLFGLTGLVWNWGLEFHPNFASPTIPANYWDALVFILEKVTLQRPAWLVPQNLVSRVLTGLSVLLIPGQAALFILALRNRLGRRR